VRVSNISQGSIYSN